ncbi:hypothetical protein MYCTH_2123303 [Thermothelomyces thermophilus ATCC 42464]|uniref:Uncharacterized protein n=1 Tax=Thermothelomyces thermophilus (strain ATCC 42464 / BCRC 31852 / DSM 1799) TaxID=573729 RepID=G2Q3R1_THET4|nr:uncharacterized protein MYCTH_2123303 [Thermothelomyces thermophilus ATCC 42464]AEO54414.1 hypothetical protein MYCTH_2123303 [Thermothelomyces thermophilus ATCC 42464]
MHRSNESRTSGPRVAPGSRVSPRRRGRPAVDWTWSRKRRLLRLYLCTPEAELPLKKILEILATGPFRPKPRHTQCLLKDMLSKSYRQKRPKSRATMNERLAFLRSVRDGRLPMHAHTAPPGEVPQECAVILLDARPGRPKSKPQERHVRGESEPEVLTCSPLQLQQPPDSETNSSFGPLEISEEPKWLLGGESTDAETLPPVLFRNPWSSLEEARYEKAERLGERCPSRTSSFLADVASLLSGLSIQSSLSRSPSCSSRRSTRSVSSRAEGLSGSKGEQEGPEERPAAALSAAKYLACSADLHVSADADETMHSPSTARDAYELGSSSPHTLENQELVRFCCAARFAMRAK